MNLKKCVGFVSLMFLLSCSFRVNDSEKPDNSASSEIDKQKEKVFPYVISVNVYKNSKKSNYEIRGDWGMGKVPKYISGEPYDSYEKTHSIEVYDVNGKLLEKYYFGLTNKGFASLGKENSDLKNDNSVPEHLGKMFFSWCFLKT